MPRLPARLLAPTLAFMLAFAPALAGATTALRPLVNNTANGGTATQQIPNGKTLQLPAPTTVNASVNLPQGTAPTSPNDGDCWTTTSGLFCRINGSTVGPMGSGGGGGSPGGSSGQLEWNNAGSFDGLTLSGDCTLVASTGVITCLKLNGVSPGYFFDGADASHLTGTLALARLGSQSANLVLAGPASGSPATPSFRALVGADLPAPGASSLGGVNSLGIVAHKFVYSLDTGGNLLARQPSCADLSDAAASCATDATDATNITAGTLPAARLPAPTTSAFGGIEAIACPSHQWVDVVPTSAVQPTCAQPAFTDISGSASAAQLSTNLSAAIDSAIGSTRGSLLERGASGWQIITPGTANYALVSNGSGADPSWQLAPLPTIAAGHVIGNSTSSSATAADTTVTALLDRALGSAQGDIAYRDASVWNVAAPSAAGQVVAYGNVGASYPAYVHAGTATPITNTSATTFSVPFPSSVTAGNLALLLLTYNNTAGSNPGITAPAGWTQVGAANNTGVFGYLFSLPLTGSEGGTSVTVNIVVAVGTGAAAASIMEFSGVNASGTFSEGLNVTTAHGGSAVTGHSITTTGATRLAVHAVGASTNSTTVTVPAAGGWNGQFDSSVNTTGTAKNGLHLDTLPVSLASLIPAPASTASAGTNFTSFDFALIPGTSPTQQVKWQYAPPPALTILQNTAGQSVTTGTWTIATWTSALQDDVSAWSAGSPTIVTVPSGYSRVRITAYITWDNSTLANRYAMIEQNGGAASLSGTSLVGDISSRANEALQSFTTRWLAVAPGNTLRLNINQATGGTRTFSQSGGFGGPSTIQFEWAP